MFSFVACDNVPGGFVLPTFERDYRPPIFLFTVCITVSYFLWHHFRHETTCFSLILRASDVILGRHALRRPNRNSQHCKIFTSTVAPCCILLFISPSSLPAIAAVHYITHQIFYHLQPTKALCPSVSQPCSLSLPCRLTTTLLSHPIS